MELTQKILHELIQYNPETGIAQWNKREIKFFKDGRQKAEQNKNIWNAKFANKEISSKDKNGYKRLTVFYKPYYLHKILWFYMTGEWPKGDIDHIDGDPSNSKWLNLRVVSHLENMKNKKRNKNNTSGTTGVWWNKRKRKWTAAIGLDESNIHLGYFDSKAEAIESRQKAEIEYGYHRNHGTR